jgi:ABC-2 type transport system ATP-binding protein
MGAAAGVGRVGALASALGIGVAIFYGCGVATADPTHSGERSSHATSTSSSSTSSDSASAGAAKASKPKVSLKFHGPKRAGSQSATPPTGSATASGKHATADADDSAADTGPSTATAPVASRAHRAPRASTLNSSSTEPSLSTAVADPQSPNPTKTSGADAAVTPPVVTGASVSPAVPSLVATTAPHRIVDVAVTALAQPTGPMTDGTPTMPADSPVTLALLAAARREVLGDLKSAAEATTAATAALPLAAAATATPAPVIAVAQTPPLGWLQHVPVIGPLIVTPVVAAIHQIPILGDVIHPFIGYPIEEGASADTPAPRDVNLTSFDGTQIYVHFMPATGLQDHQQAPTIFVGPGLAMPGSTSLNGTPLDDLLTGQLGAVGVGALRDAGYNVVTWDPRGEYRSGGTLELDSPDYEARDVSAIISWVATQPEAELDSAGDPRMGMVGASYGGGIQLVSAATDHRIDAIVPSIAWNTLNTALYKDGAFKSGWGSILTLALVATSAHPNPEIYPAAVYGLLTGRLTQAQQDLLTDRGPGDDLVDDITAPTLLIQGTVDTLFSLQEANANALTLIGNNVATKVMWFCGGHGVCSNGPSDSELITQETLAWLARYVKDDPTVDTGPQFEWVDQLGQHYSSTTYPVTAGPTISVSSSMRGFLPLRPVFGESGAIFGVLPIGATKASNAYNLTIPAATKTTYIVGAPQLTLTYSGLGTSRHVYAQLVDDATGKVIGNQVTPIPVTLDGQTHSITVALEPIAETLAPGQTITVQLVASSASYETLVNSGRLIVSGLQVTLPTTAVAADETPSQTAEVA